MTYREALKEFTRGVTTAVRNSNFTVNPVNTVAAAERGVNVMGAQHTSSPCPQLAGTLFRIFIPAGAVINFANLVELTAPSGICLILRLPFLAGECGTNPLFNNLCNTIRQYGGTIEPVS